MRCVTIYTDGSYKGKKQSGGWAAHLQCGVHEKLICGGKMFTTVNRMEITAVLEALSILTEPCNVTIYSDSTYVVKGVSKWLKGWERNNWKSAKRDIKNKDLWKQLIPLTKYHNVNIHWVKAHNGNPGNELVDSVAQNEADEIYEDYRKK